MRKKLTALLLVLVLALTACAPQPSDDPEPASSAPSAGEPLTVCAYTGAQDTFDPAGVIAQGGEMLLFHLFENLMRWTDGGDGWAVLTPGQAESYTVETDYAGNAMYTFTLREGLVWSDGQPVTAENFAAAWRRLADPANDLPHRERMAAVSGYEQVQETGDPSLLGVAAPDARTLTVSLNGSPSYFLEEICAGAYTMPVREDLIAAQKWGRGDVTNGAYTVSSQGGELLLERNASYYDASSVRPSAIRFLTGGDAESNYTRFLDGELDLVTNLPAGPLAELAEGGLWTPEPVTAAPCVLLNTQQPPFDDPNVRLAFRLAIDNQAVVDALSDWTLRPAAGLVPYGVSDYGERALPEEPAEEEPELPDPNAAPLPPEPASTFWDFRAHSLEKVTVSSERDYDADCLHAQALMAQAGYAGGGGFPVVEYLYVESEQNSTLAQILRNMWQERLGVTVAARGVSQEEYDAALALPVPEEEQDAEDDTPVRTTGSFTMAGMTLSSPYSDAGALLERWYSASPENFSGYRSDAFDILLDAARAAISNEARDAYLHDAEAILLEEAPVIPLFCQGGSYQLADGLSGLFRAPDGVYFLWAVAKESEH